MEKLKNSRHLMVRNLACVFAVTISSYGMAVPTFAQSASAPAAKMEMGANGMNHGPMKMQKSMEDMNKKMTSMKPTGNPDIDFAMMMVAHHQGAIDMAQAEVDTGKDPAMIQAAKKIIAAQKKEIAQFEVWLKKNPHPMK